MTLSTLLTRLGAAGIRLRSSGGELRVAGNRSALDSALLGQLREHKAALLEILGEGAEWWSPASPDAADGATAGDRCIHPLFEAQVRRTPDATALVHDERSLTYAELNARANRLAHHLRGLGVGPDARVAICLERGFEMVAGVLAVLKAGGAYLPLDPAYPAGRLRYMLEDSRPVAVLTRGALAGLFAGTGLPCVDFDAEAEAWGHQPDADPDPAAVGLAPEHLAYVIYTSGSTGRPKGVMVEHRAVCRMIAAVHARLEHVPADRLLHFAPLTFDVSVEDVFGALLSGAALVLRDDGWVDDARTFWALCRKHQVSVTDLPTRFWQLLAEESAVPIPECIRLVEIGGEAVEPGALSAWFQRGGHLPRLCNLYGPTETTVNATLHQPTRDPSTWKSIGGALGGTRIYIADAHGEPVPVGVAGEIHVGGGQLARGYQNRAGLTAERFIPDPFSARPGARLYRTGDLGRWRPDGTVEFLGRADDQVKLRGFRIELGEIGARLLEHPAVRDGVVALREDSPGSKRLVAYYAGEALAVEALRAWLLETLPEHMVPAAYVRLEAMPLTPHGKIDRRALPAPEGSAYAARAYEPPAGEAETAVAEVWAAVLGVERVGRHDHFFELGGHSLLAVQAASRVRRALGVEATLGDLFLRPVLADFAGGLQSAAPAELPAIDPADRGGRLAPSFAQQRLWFLERLGGTGPAYHMPVRLRLRGELDGAALRRALDHIVARHEALRTTFAEADGEPEQRIAPEAESRFQLSLHDLGDHPRPEAELRRLLADEADAPFDLAAGPLVRGRLIRLADDDHVLAMTLHHIVSDGWSMGVLTGELGALYQAFRRGEGDPLPPLPVQYADYAAWQRRWVEGEVLQRQVAYWKETLSGAPELLELPTDHARAAQQDPAGAAVGLELDDALTEGLKALGQRHGTTLFMTVLAGWAAVLSRLSGQDDLVVGTPSANRGRPEIEGLIGFFVNTLALRLDLAGAPTVAQLLGRVRARALEAQHHQDIPFEQVVEAVRPARTLSHTPLFQVMFAWENAPRGGLHLPGVQLGPVGAAGDGEAVAAKFDLTLSLSEAGGRVTGGATYRTALFERDTVERWLGYLRRVLEAMAADEGVAVDRIPMLPAAERRRVVEEWNEAAAASPDPACIHERFQAQAARTPDAVAVVFEGERLSYAELNARANRLAHHLRELGVRPDARVALCLERGPELLVALLAVLKAGGAYVPLDPAYPADRLRSTLGDSAAVALLTHSSLAAPFAGAAVPRVDVDADGAAWAELPCTNPEGVGVRPDHLAYVIYTSGSTGRPKGVMVPHRNVDRLFAATDAWYRFAATDVWTLFHSAAFDFSVWEIWGALLHGGRLVVVPAETARSPGEFYALVCREGVTVLNQTPSAFRQLIAAQAASGGEHRLRQVIFGGEALEVGTLKPWLARNGEARTRLANMYGITETTVHVTYRPIGREDVERAGPSPIGVRIPDLRSYVLDRAGEPVPVGVAGELYVGGPGVARGYLGRPALTAGRFVPDPFGGEPGARLYRTGDLARWRAEGSLEYLGRNDFQVKVRGFRIELGEIEARLGEHPSVRGAVVLARADGAGGERLVAYCVGDEPLEPDALRAYLAERLPSYMVPAAFVRLDRMPLTPNGKVDRGALPAPDAVAYATRGYEAPVGEVEEALAELWSELLGVGRVGRRDDFFQLGGHSLLVVRLIERMRRRGLHADVRALFTTPTLAELAAAVGGGPREVEVPPNAIPAGCRSITPAMLPLVGLTQAEVDRVVGGVPGGAENVQDIYPLAPLQEGILFHHLLGGEGDPYLTSHLTGFDTRERLDGFVRALQAVIDRHDVLRTGVAWEGLPEPVQVVWRKAPIQVEEVETGDAADAAAELRARFDPRHYRIDLRRAPLLRGFAARDRANGRWLLLLLLHHLADDNTSLKLIVAEVQAHLLGREDRLPPPLPFRTFVAQARLGVSRAEHEAFFTDLLRGVDEPTAPFGLLDVWGDGSGIAEARLAVDEGVAARLRERARALGVSVATLCHVAWAQVLARVSGRGDVVFGTVLFGRMQGGAGADRTVGPFINTLPLRIRVSDQGVEESVRHTHRLLGHLLRHEHASLALAQRCSGVRAPAPLFTSLLNYRHGAAAREAYLADAPESGRGIQRLHAEERTNFPLTLSVDDLGGGLQLTAQVQASVGPERVCALAHAALAGLVEALETAPETPLGRIDVLPPAERRRVVEEWNATDAGYPAGACVHDLFRAQAARTPEAVALSWRGERLTYARLEARANQISNALRRRGVGPEVRVGICLPRTPELVAAMLGVLGAGGAYVPLDPAYPRERLGYMLEDAGITLVITESALADRLPEDAPALLLLDVERDAIAAEPAEAPESGVLPENLSHVIFTSGSTGRPKGVMIRHSSVVVLLHWLRDHVTDEERSSVLFSTSINFDVSVAEVFGTLAWGGKLVIAENALELATLGEEVVHVSMVPSAAAELLKSGGIPASVKTLNLGGEALPNALAQGLYALESVEKVGNLYGPTEDTTY
ncbi:MAG TPA: amino acid adenylation domain-containing protein, partial [Longimicrobium sp.]|nr:amino acid adenylation domain-containing protein [Longimicrobium sp.]